MTDSKRLEILEQAIINLTIENAELRIEVKTAKKDKDMWYKFWAESQAKIDKLEPVKEETK